MYKEEDSIQEEYPHQSHQSPRNMSSANLANLKEVCETFEFGQETANQEKCWKAWLDNFEICTEFEGIVDEKKRRAALLAVGGPKLRELHSTLEEEEAKTYTTVKQVFNDYFKGKKNLTAERYKFLCTKPASETETHDAWITRLRKLGEDCEWEHMNMNEAIKLAVTMHTRSKKLQMSIIAQNLDYQTMVEKARAIELTKKEMDSFQTGENFNVNYVNNNRGRGDNRRRDHFKGGRGGRKPAYNPPSRDTPGVCQGCGFPRSDKHDCRARNERCMYCKEIGHYARMCPKKKQKYVNEVAECTREEKQDAEEEYHFDSLELALDHVEAEPAVKSTKTEKYPSTDIMVRINGRQVRMKIDSGADVTVIGSDVFGQIQACAQLKGQPVKLRPTNAKLKPFKSRPLKLRGVFEAQIETKRAKIISKIYVTHSNPAKALLSKFAAFDLGVLKIEVDELVNTPPKSRKQVPEVQHMEYHEIKEHLTTEETIQEKLQSLESDPNSKEQVDEMLDLFKPQFKGIGCHKFRQIKLDVDETVKPKIQAQRRMPFAKREALDEILKELESEDIIEEVVGPTERISNLVLTPKSDNKMRMNIDMTTANEAIQRTRHVTCGKDICNFNYTQIHVT